MEGWFQKKTFVTFLLQENLIVYFAFLDTLWDVVVLANNSLIIQIIFL
jgi:hypothetical protein